MCSYVDLSKIFPVKKLVGLSGTTNKIKQAANAIKPPIYPKDHPYPEILPILFFGAISGKYAFKNTPPISNPMFAIQKNNNALKTSPSLGKYNKKEKIIHTQVQKIKNNFLYPPLSAIAPIIGDKNATINEEIVIAFPHAETPASSEPKKIVEAKNVEYINVIVIVVKG